MGAVFQVPWTYIGMEAHDQAKANATAHTPTKANTVTLDQTTEKATTHELARTGGTEHFQADCQQRKPDHWSRTGVPLLRSMGFTTVALALSDESLPLHDAHLKSFEKIALILGTEGYGLAQETIDACDYTARIPMSHGVDSLNVAAASAVAFWELCARPPM